MKHAYIFTLLVFSFYFSYGQNDTGIDRKVIKKDSIQTIQKLDSARRANPADTVKKVNLPDSLKKANPLDTIKPGKGAREEQIEKIKEVKEKLLSEDSTSNEPPKHPLIDTTIMNKYGDLLDDDPVANPKSPWWKPAVEVVGINLFIHSMDRFLFKYDFTTNVNRESWRKNINTGWEWDNDRFGINFSGHPYTGGLYFSAARTQGYSYVGSIPYAVGGSLMWEYFGESTLPSYNDLINTTVNGMFLGEVLYRISSNILDDRTIGGERIMREIAAGIISPVRGINRLLSKRYKRVENKEVFQKEPLNISVYGGFQTNNNQVNTPFAGKNHIILDLQLDYGNPFELRRRKPFDVFKLRMEFSINQGRKILSNVLGYGFLFGKNIQAGKVAMLVGGFQYYDYWDSNLFELLTIGFGGGALTKLPISKSTNLYTSAHLALVPFGAHSGPFGPVFSEFRDYSYNNGFEGKIETALVLDKYLTFSLMYNYYYMHTFEPIAKDYDNPALTDAPGNNFITIFKPNVKVTIYKNLSIGYEHYVFFDERFKNYNPTVSTPRSEDKLFLHYFFEDPQRKGRYQ